MMGSTVLSSTMDDHDDIKSSIVSSFLEITTEQSVETAKHFLAATSWRLDEAVNLFFLKKADDDDEGSKSGSSSSQVSPPLIENQNHGFLKDEDQVTDSLPVRKEAALNGTEYNENQKEEDDEMMVIPPSEGDEIWKESDSLLDLMFGGSFEKAKQVALKKSKWLLLNLQSRKLNSYRLDRDICSNAGVAEIIKRNFIFLQVYDDTAEGMRISTSYNLIGSILPVVLLVDPTTGQKVWSWNGMIEGERLMQELFPYIDIGVEGIHPTLQMRNVSEEELDEEMVLALKASMKGLEEKELDEEMVLALKASTKGLEEKELDEEMVLALEASMKGLMYDDDGDDASTSTDMDEEPPMMYEESSSDEEDNYLIEEKKKITYPSLPEEPQTVDGNLVCRIGFRFPPDGRRVQRCFLRTDPIQLLWSFISSQFAEVERNRPFRLTVPHGIRGAASKALDYESKVSFEESGLSNSMILVTWND